MSFSFNVTAKNVAEAKTKVEEEMRKVREAQPDHAVDRDNVCTVVDMYLSLLQPNSADDVVSVSVSGSVSWESTGDDKRYVGASINVGVRCYKSA